MHHSTFNIPSSTHRSPWLTLALSTVAVMLLRGTLVQAQTPPTILYSDFERPDQQVYSQRLSALQLNDNGREVEALQNQLASLGYYDGPVTGYFGALTEESVRRFQQANGLPADGVAGVETLAALNQGARPISSADFAQPAPFIQPPPPAIVPAPGFTQPVARVPLTPEQRAREDQLRAEIARQQRPRPGVFQAPPVQPAVEREQVFRPVQQEFIQPARADLAAATYGNDYIQLGDYGEAVANLQRQLQRRGFYSGAIDGDFGPQTEQAVIAFQQANNLIPDGIAGPQTLTALQGGSNPVPPINPPTNPPIYPPTNPPTYPPTNPPTSLGDSGRYSVLDLQERLNRRGFYFGTFDGILGPQTLDAITSAQNSYGLSRGDVLNPF